MSFPNPLAYAFEDALEKAVQSWLQANSINRARRQMEKETLPTPRVEAKAIFGGFQQNEHYYVRADGQRWLDIGAGTLVLKIITRRSASEPTHSQLRGSCRYLMQHAGELSLRMPLHIMEKIIETPSSITIADEKDHDVSALSFTIWQRIRQEVFPTN